MLGRNPTKNDFILSTMIEQKHPLNVGRLDYGTMMYNKTHVLLEENSITAPF